MTAPTIREDEPWGWVYMTLHGHYLDHLAVIEPWTTVLRDRQTDGDPFVADPRAVDHVDFAAREAAIAADFDALVRAVPAADWSEPDLTPGWDLARPRRPPRRLGRRKAFGRSRSTNAAATGSPIRTRASTPGTSGWSARRAADGRRRPRSSTAMTPPEPRCWPRWHACRSRTCARPMAGAGPMTASTVMSGSTLRCSARGAPPAVRAGRV